MKTIEEPDLFAELGEAPEPNLASVPKTEIVPSKSMNEEREEKFRALEDEILAESMTIVRDALKFRDINAGEENAPNEWYEEGISHEEAVKRLRVANAAHLPFKEAPTGLAVAWKTMVGIVKARATEKQAPRELNMMFVEIHAELPQYPEVKVER